jgi:hypothetical protein
MRARRVPPIASALTFAASLLAGHASADGGLRVSIRWEKLAEALREGGPLLSREAWLPAAGERTRLILADRSGGSRMAPQLSLVARDWGGAQSLFGRLALTDQLRLSRSSRMVISRLRITDGTLAPFAQAGVGQWRVDTELMPVMPSDVELAGQFGGGVDFHMGRGAALGVEADYTILYREQHEPQMLSGPHLWATYFAARLPF